MKQTTLQDSVLNLLLPLALILGLVLLSLNPGQICQTAEAVSPLERGLKVIVGYLAGGAEISAAVVIGGAIARGILSYVRQLFSWRQQLNASEAIRLRLGRLLALGLEFTIASDILRTAITPTH